MLIMLASVQSWLYTRTLYFSVLLVKTWWTLDAEIETWVIWRKHKYKTYPVRLLSSQQYLKQSWAGNSACPETWIHLRFQTWICLQAHYHTWHFFIFNGLHSKLRLKSICVDGIQGRLHSFLSSHRFLKFRSLACLVLYVSTTQGAVAFNLYYFSAYFSVFLKSLCTTKMDGVGS